MKIKKQTLQKIIREQVKKLRQSNIKRFKVDVGVDWSIFNEIIDRIEIQNHVQIDKHKMNEILERLANQAINDKLLELLEYDEHQLATHFKI